MISVIIPVYNQADKLIKTLESLVKQEYQDLEIIIINDGSVDNPEQNFIHFIEKNNSNIAFTFLNQENKGAPAARNTGYYQSKGDFLFFCDADAVLNPKALSTLQDALSFNAEASYAFSSFKWGYKLFKVGPFSAEKLIEAPFIHTMSLIRREDFPQTGWDEGIKKLQDWDLWLTMLEQKKYGIFVDQVLFKISPGGTISSWLPSFIYKLMPFLPTVKKYKKAVEIIKNKHNL